MCSPLVFQADRASSDKRLDIRVEAGPTDSIAGTLIGFLHPEVSKVQVLQYLMPLISGYHGPITVDDDR